MTSNVTGERASSKRPVESIEGRSDEELLRISKEQRIETDVGAFRASGIDVGSQAGYGSLSEGTLVGRKSTTGARIMGARGPKAAQV